MTSLLPAAMVLGCGVLSALILFKAFVNVLSRDFADRVDEEP